jgi:MarR family transcriptional regulator, negative regulator of the multidrug operon emrRAB
MMNSRLANLVGALGTALHDSQIAEVTAPGLTATEASALNRVGQIPGCSINDLRIGLGISQPGTVRVVDGLVRRDLVTRAAGRDGRTVALQLTELGRTTWEALVDRRRAMLADALAAVPQRDLPALERAVSAVLSALTGGPDEAEHICRLCDEASCPQASCPVTLAVPGRAR